MLSKNRICVAALLSAIALLSIGQELLPGTSSAPLDPAEEILGHIILFEHKNLRGAHKHVFNRETNLANQIDDSFNDLVSSVVVLSGTWLLYEDVGLKDPYPAVLERGIYRSLGEVGIDDDEISSLEVIPLGVPVLGVRVVTGDVIFGHAILFEHKSLRGAHRHIFNHEDDLAATQDDHFNDTASSLVILSGNWELYDDRFYGAHSSGPAAAGVYRSAASVGCSNDAISSLRQRGMVGPIVFGEQEMEQAILFEHMELRGEHRHIFSHEPNLAAAQDSFFNDRVSSAVLLCGLWKLYEDSYYENPYLREGNPLGEGIYRRAGGDAYFENDDMSSLRWVLPP